MGIYTGDYIYGSMGYMSEYTQWDMCWDYFQTSHKPKSASMGRSVHMGCVKTPEKKDQPKIYEINMDQS